MYVCMYVCTYVWLRTDKPSPGIVHQGRTSELVCEWMSDWWQTPFPWSYQITEHKQVTLSHPIIRHVARSLSRAHLNGPILTPSLLSLHAIARVICFAVLRHSSLATALFRLYLTAYLDLWRSSLLPNLSSRCCSSSFPLAAQKNALSTRSPWLMLTLR